MLELVVFDRNADIHNGKADAHGHLNRFVFIRKRGNFHGAANALGQDHRSFYIGFRGDNDELLAAHSTDGVHRSHRRIEHLGQVDEHLVAAGVEVATIDLAEVIGVNETQGQGAWIARSAANLGIGQPVNCPAVRNTCQRIGQGQLLQHHVLLLEFMVGFLQAVRAFQHALLELKVDLAQLFHEPLVLALQREALGGFAQDLNQLVHAPWLEKVAVDLAAIDGFDGIFQLGKAGHEQANGPRRFFPDPFEQLNAAHNRHFLVGQNEINALLSEDLLRGFSGISGKNCEIRGQKGGQGGQDVRLVVDYQQ